MRTSRMLPVVVRAVALVLVLAVGAVGCADRKDPHPRPARPTSTQTATASATPGGAGASAPMPRPSGPGVMTGPAGSQRLTGTQAVALTFDDGPDPVNTPKLLDVLRAQGVKATFCLVGHRVRDNQEIVKRIAAEGHTLCNHSWQHLQDLGKRPDAYLRRDLVATNEQIHRAVPGAPIRYFRAPYGNFSERLNRFATELGMIPLSWSVDDECWRTANYGHDGKMVDHMMAMVQQYTRPGGIILGHDNLKPHTVVAYQRILPWLKARFTLVPMPVE